MNTFGWLAIWWCIVSIPTALAVGAIIAGKGRR